MRLWFNRTGRARSVIRVSPDLRANAAIESQEPANNLLLLLTA
jgi:hypothetical protein